MTAVLSSASTAVASATVTLTAAVVMTVSVYQLANLSMTSVFTLLVIPPSLSKLRVLTTAAAALTFLQVIDHLIPWPAVDNAADVIHSELFSYGDVRSVSGLDTLNFLVELDL